jgi:FkbM family methyltransferase
MLSKLRNLKRLLPLLLDVRAVKAMATWPEFSITAYKMVSDLDKQNIQPRTLIDVGANIGQFTIAAINIFDNLDVHAFEPIKACADQLRANVSGYDDVQINALALGARCEKSAFHINTYSLASSMLRISNKHLSEFSQATEKNTITIEVSTLDDHFSDKALLSPVLLKIDVQGAEKCVIEGGTKTLKQVDYVLLETSFTPMYEGEPLFIELIETMKSFKFEFLRPLAFLKSPKSGEILQADILFKNSGIRVS